MPGISSSARQIIILIGNAGDKTTWGEVSFPQLSRLLQIHTIKSDLRNTLEWLKSHDLISEKPSQSGETSLALTHQGFRLYCAIKYEGGLTMPYDQIGIETSLNLDLEKDLSFVENFFVTWSGNFVHVLRSALRGRGLADDSILLCYLALLSSPFDWLAHSLFYGAYDVVLRELRSVLEGMFAAYNLDTQNHGKSLDEKLNAMTDLEQCGRGHGISVFRSSGIPDWRKHYTIYTELCGYVHSTRQITGHRIQEVAEAGFPELVEPGFNRDGFAQCVSIWRQIGNSAVILANQLLRFYGIEECVFRKNVLAEV